MLYFMRINDPLGRFDCIVGNVLSLLVFVQTINWIIFYFRLWSAMLLTISYCFIVATIADIYIIFTTTLNAFATDKSHVTASTCKIIAFISIWPDNLFLLKIIKDFVQVCLSSFYNFRILCFGRTMNCFSAAVFCLVGSAFDGSSSLSI